MDWYELGFIDLIEKDKFYDKELFNKNIINKSCFTSTYLIAGKKAQLKDAKTNLLLSAKKREIKMQK